LFAPEDPELLVTGQKKQTVPFIRAANSSLSLALSLIALTSVGQILSGQKKLDK